MTNPRKEEIFISKLINKTKVTKNCPKSHFSFPDFISKKNEEEKKVDSFQICPFSNGNKVFKNLEKNRNEDIDIQMNVNESLKDAQNDEPMDVVNEEEINKKTISNDSLDK